MPLVVVAEKQGCMSSNPVIDFFDFSKMKPDKMASFKFFSALCVCRKKMPFDQLYSPLFDIFRPLVSPVVFWHYATFSYIKYFPRILFEILGF